MKIDEAYNIPERVTQIHPHNKEALYEDLLAYKIFEGMSDKGKQFPDIDWQHAWDRMAGTDFSIWLSLKLYRESHPVTE